MRNFETGRNTPISYQYQLCKMSVEDSVAKDHPHHAITNTKVVSRILTVFCIIFVGFLVI